MNFLKQTRFLWIFIVVFTAFSIFIGCDDDPKDMTGPAPALGIPPHAGNPTPTPTPAGAWGYIAGHAEVKVTELNRDPDYEKEVIFCLGNPENENWVNVRHRSGGKYQIKGGLDPDTDCVDELHYSQTQCADNGIWTVDWYKDGRVTIASPCGSETLHIPGGKFAFRNIYDGSCGGYIHWNSASKIEVLSIEGESGYATDCNL